MSHDNTGGCMCGEIRYELDCESPWTVYCHCESCRKHSGAPVVALVTIEPHQVIWTSGDRKLYESSPGRIRSFCGNCGTTLTWEVADWNGSWLAIHVGTFDSPAEFPPTEHIFHGEATPWLHIDDDLPRREGSEEV